MHSFLLMIHCFHSFLHPFLSSHQCFSFNCFQVLVILHCFTLLPTSSHLSVFSVHLTRNKKAMDLELEFTLTFIFCLCPSCGVRLYLSGFSLHIHHRGRLDQINDLHVMKPFHNWWSSKSVKIFKVEDLCPTIAAFRKKMLDVLLIEDQWFHLFRKTFRDRQSKKR